MRSSEFGVFGISGRLWDVLGIQDQWSGLPSCGWVSMNLETA